MVEGKVLVISIWATALFAALGVWFGIISESSIIIFDGVYSLISVGLSYMSLLALKHIESDKDDKRFPFGKVHFEPLLIVFKSLTIIGMCLYSATNAFADLMSGGREVSPGPAIVYAVITTIGCIFLTVFIQRKNKLCESNLLAAEKNQWLGDSFLSVGVLLGFTIAYKLTDTELSWIVAYADPAMVIVASSLFIVLPFRNFLDSAREMLFFRVDEKILEPVERAAQSIANEYEAKYRLRMISIGRELNIEINVLLDSETSLSVSDMDRARRAVAATAIEMNKKHWVNVSFTSSKTWM